MLAVLRPLEALEALEALEGVRAGQGRLATPSAQCHVLPADGGCHGPQVFEGLSQGLS